MLGTNLLNFFLPFFSEEWIKGSVFLKGRLVWGSAHEPTSACLLPSVSAPVSGPRSDVDSRPPFSVLMELGSAVTHQGPSLQLPSQGQ